MIDDTIGAMTKKLEKKAPSSEKDASDQALPDADFVVLVNTMTGEAVSIEIEDFLAPYIDLIASMKITHKIEVDRLHSLLPKIGVTANSYDWRGSRHNRPNELGIRFSVDPQMVFAQPERWAHEMGVFVRKYLLDELQKENSSLIRDFQMMDPDRRYYDNYEYKYQTTKLKPTTRKLS